MSSPSIANGVVYFGSDDGSVYAVAASGCGQSSCQPLWAFNTGGAVVAAPAVSDGVVYAASGDGKLYVFTLPSASADRNR